MEKITALTLTFLLSISQVVQAQNASKKEIDRTHLISTNLAFTPSIIFQESLNLFYINGALTFYPTPKVSFRGDAAFSFREFNNEGNIDIRYHSVFFGACYHFTENGAFDPFVGIQPGFSFLERSYTSILPFENIIQEYIPNASVIAGLNFYVNRYFSLFANVRYVYGQPMRNTTVGSGLHEIRFAFGLGINLAKWQ